MSSSETLNNALNKLKLDNYDIILLDLNLPDSRGIETFENISILFPEIPILLVTGLEDEDLAKKLIKAGAQDYLPKIRLDSFILERAISYAIERSSFINRVKHLNSVLNAIRNINKLIVKVEDRNILVGESTKLLVEARGYNQALCILFDYNGRITNYGMTSEDKSIYPAFQNEMEKGTIISCLKKALDKREPIIIEEIEKDCPFATYIPANKDLGLIILPLYYLENIYGILAISMNKKFINDPDEHSLLIETSGDISYALYNMQLNAEKRQAQHSLKSSEEKYRAFVEDDLTGDYLVTPDGQFLYCNASFLNIFGFNNIEEAFNYNAYKLYFNSSSRDEFVKLVIEKKKIELIESDILRPDGKTIRIVENVVGNFDEKGNLIDIRGYVIDITKRTIAENNIKKNNERLNILLKIYEHETKNEKDFLDFSLSEAMKLTSSKLGYLYFYDEIKREFILNSWSNEVMSNCKVQNPQTCYELDKTGIWGEAVRQRKTIIINDFQSKHPLKKGYPEGHIELNNFMTIPIFDNANIIAVVGVANKDGDYDESDETQLQLLMNSVWRILEKKKATIKATKLSKAVEQSPVSILVTNKNGIIEYANSKFLELTGYSLSEVLGKTPAVVKSGFHPKEFYENLWRTILSGNDFNAEMLNKKKTGELFWERSLISTITDELGEITNFIAVKEDITEKKKMIEELILAKEKAEFSNKLKSEFLAQMSHEIRSPMNVIISFSSLIRDDLGKSLSPELSEYFDGIDTASRRLIRTVDLILNTSEMKIGTYEPAFTELEILSEILDGVRHEYDLLIRNKGLEFNYHSDIPKAMIIGDKYSLHQIFVNILDNAYKYTKVGSISINVNSKEDELFISIEDTGIGISKEFMENIFEPFMQEEMGYSRRYEGNGLGLALVKNYCDLNRASISVESKKGVGSKFTITFAQIKNKY